MKQFIIKNYSGAKALQLSTLTILFTGMLMLMTVGLYTPVTQAQAYQSKFSSTVASKQKRTRQRKQLISYLVRRGDTIYSIAKTFRVTPARIRRWNRSIRGNRIKRGQSLRLYIAIRSSRHRRRISSPRRRSRRISSSRSRKRKRSSIKRFLNPRGLRLRSQSAAIVDLKDGVILYHKRMNKRRPIASLTKLMTAMVILDARLQLNKRIRITSSDKDWLRFSRSRLRVGTVLRRKDLLYMALAASENRASHALARTFPGGKRGFIRAMNRKARELKMTRSRFADASGLSNGNLSTARDLVRMVRAANGYPFIRRMTTSKRGWVRNQRTGRIIQFNNTNRLVRRGRWKINVSKTGFINEAGYCLVMHANINRRPVVIVLLKSAGKYSKFGDANRIKRWISRGLQKSRAKHRRYSSTSSFKYGVTHQM